MADLVSVDEGLPVRISGVSSTSGIPDNFADVNSLGQLQVNNASDGPVTPGTAAGSASLNAGQYNSTLPTLNTGQQSAVQVDSSGRLITSTFPQIVTGTIAGVGQSVVGGAGGTVLIEVTGTWSGVIEVFGNIDGSGYGLFVSAINGASPLSYTYAQITSNGVYKVVTSASDISTTIQGISWTSGTATITVNSAASASIVESVQFNQANMLVTAFQGGSWTVTSTNPSITFTGNPPPTEATYIGGSVTTAAPTYTTGTFQGFSLNTAGSIRVIDSSDGPVTPGTAALFSSLIGGQFNTSLPTLTNTQQSALQLDSSGRLIISPTTQGPLAEDHNYGTVGSDTLRTASQIGNATGAADFNAGATGAQTLRVVLSTDQTGIATFLDKSGSGTIAALNATVIATTNGCSNVTFDVTGTWVATIVIEGTTGDGNWFGVNGDVDVTDSITGSFTTNTFVTVPCGSLPQVRLRASLYTSGTATVNWDSSAGVGLVEVFNTNPASLITTTRLNDASGNAVAAINSQLETRDVLNVAAQGRAQSVTTTAAEALGAATILANRKLLHITPTNGTIYWGYTSGVTTTTGTPLFPNDTLWLSVTDNIHVYVIAGATTDTRIGELS